MSVLIKGMEMPTDHPLWIVVHPDGTVEANEVSASRPVGWQTLRNAAVPVPPHGDLVDRDEMFVEFVDEGQKTTRYKVGEKWELNGEEIRRVIQRLPAVITAEEATQKEGGHDEAPAGPYDLL